MIFCRRFLFVIQGVNSSILNMFVNKRKECYKYFVLLNKTTSIIEFQRMLWPISEVVTQQKQCFKIFQETPPMEVSEIRNWVTVRSSLLKAFFKKVN